MKLIAGLGNPGKKYDKTRHNVGFDVLDELARCHASGRPKAKFEGVVNEATIDSHRVLLLWPQKYMNLSGVCVQAAASFYNIEGDDILIVCDDFNLPLGKLRLRPKGSAGGQKGLSDIIQRLGTDQIGRLRLGVGPVPDRWDPADFVLSRFSKKDRPLIDEQIAQAADATRCWVAEGVEASMNQFN